VFGPIGIGLFSRDDALRDDLMRADRMAGEKLWPLPLWAEYRELLNSHVADLRNISTTIQYGSMMTAATFLAEFVGDAVWAHLDIHNTAWNDSDHPYLPKGPTGAGTRTLVQYLMGRAER
jgi:leucyl aminopeptidase